MLLILTPAILLAQTPPAGQTQAPPPPTPPQAAPPVAPATPPRQAAPSTTLAGTSKVAIIDIQRALSENVDGKKAVGELNSAGAKKQEELEKLQKSIQEAQEKLRTQDRLLNDQMREELNRTITNGTTELNRKTEDAQREMQDLQNRLLQPIYQLTQRVLSAYANEMGLTLVFDTSSQASSIVYANDLADITTEIIRRMDAEIAKTVKPGEKNE
jgi:Skp family chaperone for outer membrane proteins